MRLMLKFTIPVDRGNEAAKDGTLGATINALIEKTSPEAAYFSLENGERAGMIVFEADDQAFLPRLNEELFSALNAAVQITPVLNLQDLERGLTAAST